MNCSAEIGFAYHVHNGSSYINENPSEVPLPSMQEPDERSLLLWFLRSNQGGSQNQSASTIINNGNCSNLLALDAQNMNGSPVLTYDFANEEYIFDKPHVRVIFFVLYSIVFCFCFFGNLAVVLVVTLHWKMRSITKFCLGNLAFANLCVGIFCVYQNLSLHIMESWWFGNFLCKMYHFTNSLSHTASILILVVICVERYLAILHPFRCRQILTIQRLRIIIVAVWIISAILCSPRLYYIDLTIIPLSVPNETPTYQIICHPIRTLYDSHIADWINFILLFLFPLIVISILYTRVGIFLWKSSSVLLHAKNFGGRAGSPFNSSVNHSPFLPNNSATSQTPSEYSSGCTSQNSDSSTSHKSGESSSGSGSANDSSRHKSCSHKSSAYKLKRFGRTFRNRRKDKKAHYKYASPPSTPSTTHQSVRKRKPTLKCINANHNHDHERKHEYVYPSEPAQNSTLNKPNQTTTFPILNLSENVNVNICLVNKTGNNQSTLEDSHQSTNNIPVPGNTSPPIKPNIISSRRSQRSASTTSLCSAQSGCRHNKCVNIQKVLSANSVSQQKQKEHQRSYNVKSNSQRPNKVRRISWDKKLVRCFTNSSISKNRKKSSGRRSCRHKLGGKTLKDNLIKNNDSFWARLKKGKSGNISKACSDQQPPIFPSADNDCCSLPTDLTNNLVATTTRSTNVSSLCISKGKRQLGSQLGCHDCCHCQHLSHEKSVSHRCSRSSLELLELTVVNSTELNTNDDGYPFQCPCTSSQTVVGHLVILETSFTCTSVIRYPATYPGDRYGSSKTQSVSPSVSVGPSLTSGLHTEFSLVTSATAKENSNANSSRASTTTNSTATSATPLSRVRLTRHNDLIRSDFFNTSTEREAIRRRKRREKFLEPRQAVVRMLITIVVTFAVCNLPFHLRKICQNYVPNYDFGSDFSNLITPLTHLFMYINCAINPILYAFMSKSFRVSFKDLVQCRLKRPMPSRMKDSTNIV